MKLVIKSQKKFEMYDFKHIRYFEREPDPDDYYDDIIANIWISDGTKDENDNLNWDILRVSKNDNVNDICIYDETDKENIMTYLYRKEKQ